MEYMILLVIRAAALSLLAVLVLFLWREHRLDVFRQRIFEMRDDLFDFAAKGQMSFDDPAYGALRGLLNSYIRFAHRVTLPRAFAMLLLRRKYPNSALDRSLGQLLSSVHQHDDPVVKEKLLQVHAAAGLAIFRYVAWPIMFLAVPSFLAIFAGTSIYRRLTKRRDELTRTIEVEALDNDPATPRGVESCHFQPV